MRGFFLFALMLFPALVLVADAYLGEARTPSVTTVVALDSAPRGGVVGQAVLIPLEVRITDGNDNGVPGVRVVWSSGDGGGSMAPLTSISDDNGVASSRWTLGTVAGSYVARAMVSGLRDSVVTFHAVATPDSVTSISPAPAVAGGDSIFLMAADRFGNPVPRAEISWMFSRLASPDTSITSDRGVLAIPLVSSTDTLIVSSAAREVVFPPAAAPPPADDATWLERVSGVPPARIGHALAYDPANGNGVLFGGMATDEFRDMWLWTSDGWNEARPTTMPPTRIDHAMAFDGGGIMLFGGISGSTVLDDLWLWDGRAWTVLSVARGPAGRYGHAMVRDTARGLVVLFGGVAGPAVGFSDTWTWDGSAWRPVSSALSPSPRLGHAMAYDTQRRRIVLYGGSGVSGTGGLLRDTWEYTGNTWSRVPTPVAPPGLTGHAMAYDETRGRVVLFGGIGVNGPVNETWEYDGRSWPQRITAAHPEPREDAAMFFDPNRQRVVLYGGGAGVRFSDTWEYRIP